MRGSRWFIFFVLAFLLLMFAIEYHLPKKFVWVPTFSHYDEQPFGCAVFDSLLTVSLPSGYTLSRKTFYQMEQEDTVHNKGILLIATNLPFGRVKNNGKTVSSNIDFYSGFVYEMIGLPQEIFTPLFAMARIVGWCAHRNEELNFEGKRIIRPAYKNVLDDLAYIPIKKR